jgi:hypothetical protein
MACLVCTMSAAHSQTPQGQTPYALSGLRLEARYSPPFPETVLDDAVRRERERQLAAAGVRARWIQGVSSWGSPLIPNPHLPVAADTDPAHNAELLRKWVADIHDAGMTAMSWYALHSCKSAWAVHPEWRAVSFLPWQADGSHNISCCINSPYGEAVIEYCIHMIESLDLDGIWFDGAVWSPIWNRPFPLCCACSFCRERFAADTGLEFPAAPDWNNPAFRAWTAWRYTRYSEFIGELSSRIRAAHPDAALVVNHYHRPGMPWHSAMPIDRFEADIIAGSEAFDPDTLDLTTRLCRAYRRDQAEVWRSFDSQGTPEQDADRLLRHALGCYVAGGHPSFGGDLARPGLVRTAALMAPVMDAIQPHTLGTQTIRYAALHVSQQTETFHFGRGGTFSQPGNLYWQALGLWTEGLGQEHVPVDYVFDADLRTPDALTGYSVLLMPLSQALSEEQVRTALAFAQQGGVLVLGPGTASLDTDGQPASANALREELGLAFSGPPAADGSDPVALVLYDREGTAPVASRGMFVTMELHDPSWELLWTGRAQGRSGAIAERPFGQGRLLALNVDPAPIADDRTRVFVTDEHAAAGTWSLKFEDAPGASRPYLPLLDNSVEPFSAPGHTGGELNCDIMVDPQAVVSFAIRSSENPIHGPAVSVGPGGRVVADGKEVCEVPFGEWFHLRIAYTFAPEPQVQAAYELTVALGDGRTFTSTCRAASPGYHRTNWLVVFGAGEQEASFYIDNLELHRLPGTGEKEQALALGFEEGPNGFQEQTQLARTLAGVLKAARRPPVDVRGPDSVRAGFYRGADGKAVVHLHDRLGTRADWETGQGPSVVLECAFAVERATLEPGGIQAPVRATGPGQYEIAVPAVPLYRIAVLEPEPAE